VIVRIVIDCDPGNGIPGADVDDGLALGLAVRSPELEIEAVTVVAGNVPVDRGVECALEVLEVAGAGHIPVHRGAERPLTTDPAAWRARLDERRDDPAAQVLWSNGPPPPPSTSADPLPAVRALLEIVEAAPGEVTVVAIGPLTNIASAMLLDPTWASKVRGIVSMSGAFDVQNLIHELNAAYDPEATGIVLRSEVPMTLVPLDVTLATHLRHTDVDRLAAVYTPLATYLAETVRPWVSWLAERFERDGCPLHDPLAVATMLDPTIATTRRACVDIELGGRLTRGRTVSWDPSDDELLAGVSLPDVRPIDIVDGVDNDRFVELLLERLSR
jgi:inosine-uridine nucleoside N-ribohydrolase